MFELRNEASTTDFPKMQKTKHEPERERLLSLSTSREPINLGTNLSFVLNSDFLTSIRRETFKVKVITFCFLILTKYKQVSNYKERIRKQKIP